MRIIDFRREDMGQYGKTSDCAVGSIHVSIDDINQKAADMITTISDDSWITKLGAIERVSYEARAGRTIRRIVEDILTRVDNSVTSEFGEILISDTAQCSLVAQCNHERAPLAELFGRKIAGNPGFDFHTESDVELICFGEAKYSSTGSPWHEAIPQIIGFIQDEKDNADLILISPFVSGGALDNAVNGQKSYAAAFSINAQNPRGIFENALRSNWIDTLLAYPELYLVGIEINA